MSSTLSSPSTVVIGGGGQGRELASILRAAGVTVGGVFDDGQPSPELLARLDITLLGPLDGMRGAGEVHYLAAWGTPARCAMS